MRVVPYINFNGDCRQAFEFYHQVFGGDPPLMFTNEDGPMEGLPDSLKDKVLHAELEFLGQKLMGSDVPSDMYQTPTGLSVSLHTHDTDEAKRCFDALSAGGNVIMPWGPQPWGALFGMATDKFGVPWLINCEQTA